MIKSGPLVQLIYAAEAAGYATAGSCETGAEWDAAMASCQRRHAHSRLALAFASASSTLMNRLFSVLLVMI